MRILWISVCVLCLALGQAWANSEEENGDLLASALSALDSEDWVTAEHFASQISDPVGLDLVTWVRLRAGEGTFDEYEDFLSRNDDWPGLKRLRRRGEAAIPKNHRATSVRAYFANQLPQTGTGSLRLAEAFAAQGRTGDARGEAIRAWRNLSLSGIEQAELLKKYNGALTRHHQARLNNLLWRKSTREAERMFEFVPDAQVKLAKARIGLQRAAKGVDILIEEVPASLRDDAGLAFDRFMWRVKKGRWDDAEALLIERTGVKPMGRAEAWASRRRGFARRAMRAGDAELAYRLASQHGLMEGSDYADLEWLAGYLSLRKLGEPKRALAHFQNFQRAVASPISLGRAGYWTGRTQEALDQTTEAALSYAIGAQYQTSFYGQLAAEKIDAVDDSLTGLQATPDWRLGTFNDTGVMRAALLLHYAQEQGLARWFFTHIAESQDRTGLAQLADLALELDRPHIALKIAKQAADMGYVLPKSYFPVTDLAYFSADIDPEIAMAIARRESELDADVVSPAGARGLMQVMPGTARDVAEELGLEYSKNRLTSDWRYNATLGTAYLAGLLEIYNGSYILAFAAYNAGPGRVDEWIGTYGDPRGPNIDKVDWIEHIPYRETRNYVMRVMESLHVYRARLDGQTRPVRISEDLNRG